MPPLVPETVWERKGCVQGWWGDPSDPPLYLLTHLTGDREAGEYLKNRQAVGMDLAVSSLPRGQWGASVFDIIRSSPPSQGPN